MARESKGTNIYNIGYNSGETYTRGSTTYSSLPSRASTSGRPVFELDVPVGLVDITNAVIGFEYQFTAADLAGRLSDGTWQDQANEYDKYVNREQKQIVYTRLLNAQNDDEKIDLMKERLAYINIHGTYLVTLLERSGVSTSDLKDVIESLIVNTLAMTKIFKPVAAVLATVSNFNSKIEKSKIVELGGKIKADLASLKLESTLLSNQLPDSVKLAADEAAARSAGVTKSALNVALIGGAAYIIIKRFRK